MQIVDVFKFFIQGFHDISWRLLDNIRRGLWSFVVFTIPNSALSFSSIFGYIPTSSQNWGLIIILASYRYQCFSFIWWIHLNWWFMLLSSFFFIIQICLVGTSSFMSENFLIIGYILFIDASDVRINVFSLRKSKIFIVIIIIYSFVINLYMISIQNNVFWID